MNLHAEKLKTEQRDWQPFNRRIHDRTDRIFFWLSVVLGFAIGSVWGFMTTAQIYIRYLESLHR